ncbi:MAG: D-glycero-beta-D-manno-heptose-7-phosphate kinase [Alphaproteobacteria bacterium]|nr:D-glycero-beta-D-manno-heptose-7-phosphate kinase [Alphaproteobacteria bacterium]
MSDRAILPRHIERMAGVKLLCVGDVMLDHFIYGAVERISPEAPIPVLTIGRESRMLGGAGNVVRNATSLGAQVSLIAFVGDDAAGRDVAGLIAQQPNISANLIVIPGRPTTVKTRFVAHAQQLLRVDQEETAAPDCDVERRLCEMIDGEIQDAHVLVISDYGKGVVSKTIAAHAIAAARKAHKPVVVDTKATDLGAFRGASLITPNARELSAAARLAATTDAEVEVAAVKLIADFDLEAVVVTRSERGMTIVERGKVAVHLATEAREVFDVSGAGDTVLALLALTLGAGGSLADAATLANAGAGIVVGKAGTAVVHADELLRVLRSSEMKSVQDKVMSFDAAAEAAAGWREKRLSVGFTNGCFDLLHPGHVALLTQARATCDRLIVGLNTDASVKRLKGDDRPVNSEMARAIVLAALGMVDAVVLFDDDTPLKLIEAIKPGVLIKGADYKLDAVVGAEFVASHGGRVVLADLVPGQSTTSTIQRMDGKAKTSG